MSTSRSMLYSAGDGWQAVELPYEGEDLAMLVIVPDAGALGAAENDVPFASAADRLEARPVRLTLPKFEMTSSFSVGDTLESLGMTSSFSVGDTLESLGMQLAFSRDADFSGMTTEDELRIGAVIHQANITVDEFGTEAAAATAVFMETTSAAPSDEPVELVVDRPFLFAVRDRTSAAVLFLGRVGDPTA
jgi:serpin B